MTVKSYCMHGQHMVDEDKISYLVTPQGRRRMCEDCKAEALDRRKQERERVALEAQGKNR